MADLTKEVERERKDKEALKSQANSLNKEYDRLTEEYSKLQKKVTVSAGKDDWSAPGRISTPLRLDHPFFLFHSNILAIRRSSLSNRSK